MTFSWRVERIQRVTLLWEALKSPPPIAQHRILDLLGAPRPGPFPAAAPIEGPPPAFRGVRTSPAGPGGPRITLVNDEPGRPAPPNLMDVRLAQAIEAAVIETGLSININSTSGGQHSTWSGHYFMSALDVNGIGGRRVDDPANRANVMAFQQALARQGVRENFGPTLNQVVENSGQRRDVQPDGHHDNHVHVGTIRRDRPQQPGVTP